MRAAMWLSWLHMVRVFLISRSRQAGAKDKPTQALEPNQVSRCASPKLFLAFPLAFI